MKPVGVGASLRRLPAQNRGRDRVHQVLDTAAALLREVGYDATTVQLIATRADLHIGSIYHFFPDRTAIFAMLLSRVDDEIDRQLEQLDATLPQDAAPEDWSEAFVRALERIWRDTEHLAETYQALQRNRAVQEQNTARYQGIIGRIAAALTRWLADRPLADRRRIAFSMYSAASGTLDDLSFLPQAQRRRAVLDLMHMLALHLRGEMRLARSPAARRANGRRRQRSLITR